MKPTALVKLEITRYEDGRIVGEVACNVSGDTMHASEEFGPFATVKEVTQHCERLALGYLSGGLPDVLLSEFSNAAGMRFPPAK